MSHASSTQLIRIGHSPDPDDAFMFYALAHEKINMRGFRVEHVIEDIESLNQRALRAELEVTAVSCHAFAYLSDAYAVMRSGASVGDNYGPILVTRSMGSHIVPQDVAGKRIAIPGKLTTAFLVLQLYAKGFIPVFISFDQILEAVKNGQVDYGLIIHEGQITYAEHGLSLAVDLGKWWHETTRLPLPLGIDIIRKDLGPETVRAFARLFKESIEYALTHRKEALEYARQYGRGIAEDLNDRFVGMYVNDYTVDLGQSGEAGFRRLMEEAYRHQIIPKQVHLEFI